MARGRTTGSKHEVPVEGRAWGVGRGAGCAPDPSPPRPRPPPSPQPTPLPLCVVPRNTQVLEAGGVRRRGGSGLRPSSLVYCVLQAASWRMAPASWRGVCACLCLCLWFVSMVYGSRLWEPALRQLRRQTPLAICPHPPPVVPPAMCERGTRAANRLLTSGHQ
jgi:hypothetical protein